MGLPAWAMSTLTHREKRTVAILHHTELTQYNKVDWRGNNALACLPQNGLIEVTKFWRLFLVS
jgi:hypothetical protein